MRRLSQQCMLLMWASLGEWVYNQLNSSNGQHRCIWIRMLIKTGHLLGGPEPQSQTQSSVAEATVLLSSLPAQTSWLCAAARASVRLLRG